MLYLKEFVDYGNNAGTKARNDVESLISKLDGWRSLNDKPLSVSKVKTVGYYLSSLIIAFQIALKLLLYKNKNIFFQYPINKGKFLNRFVKISSRKNHIFLLVHDVEFLRESKNGLQHKVKEINFFNSCSGLIVHNEKMKEKCLEEGVKVKNIVALKLFDYLCEDKVLIHRKKSKVIVYAGSLFKSSFLEKISYKQSNEIILNLYGPNYSHDLDSNIIKYQGQFDPDELPYLLEGSYGLVWDGVSTKACSGDFGDYMKYNNPHKLSLYIAAGLPIIAWKYSAISDLIISKDLGIIVSTLDEIPQRLDMITEEEYNGFVENVFQLRRKIICGYFTKGAINRLNVK